MRRTLIPLLLLTIAGLALGRLYLEYFPFEIPRGGVALLVAGTAERPFVYRQLAPLLVRAGMAASGAELQAVATALIYAGWVGWLWALRALASALYDARTATIAALLAAGPVGLLFVSGGYLYDAPHLALFTLALALLARGHHRAYLALFPLLVLSRETALLLVPVWYALTRRGMAALLQLASWAGVWLALGALYGGNPGSGAETHLAEHYAFLTAYPAPNLLALTLYGACLLAALHRWRDQPPFLQAAALVVPAVFFAYWLLGFPGEVRVLLEAYPVLYLLVFHTVWTRGARPTARRIMAIVRPNYGQQAA